MPHAVIQDACPPARLFQEFEPWQEALPDGTRVEAKAAFLRRDEQILLIQALVLELGPPVHFFVAVESKKADGQVTVRLFPHPSPARTPGVQAAVAGVARRLLARGGEVVNTNLEL